MLDLKAQIEDFGRRARAAARVLARTSSEQKNRGLRAMADEIIAASQSILEANAKDLAHATTNGLAKPAVLAALVTDMLKNRPGLPPQ